MRRNRREQNPVAKMPRCHEVAGRRRNSQNWQIVRRSRPQACPSLKYASSTQCRDQAKRGPVHLFNRSGIGALVKTCFFHRRTDQDASIAAWYQINFGRANHVPRCVPRTAGDGEHLSLYWTRRKLLRPKISRPGSGAVHDDGRSIASLIGAHAADAPVGNQYLSDLVSGGDVNPTMLRRFHGGCTERSRIDTAFLQENCGPRYIAERWLKLGQRRWQQRLCRKSCTLMNVLRRREQDRAIVAQVDIDSRLILQLVNKFGIHPRACRRQRLQKRRSLQTALNEHSRSRVRSLAARLSTLHHQNPRSTLAQRNRQREPDDPATNDDDVPGFHS